MPPAKSGVRRGARTQTAKQVRENPLAVEEELVDIEIEDLTSSDPVINGIVHGPYGSGKTVLAAGASRDYKCYFLSTETEGLVSARRSGSVGKLIRAQNWERATSGVSWAEDHLGKDDWLIVDSGTKMHRLYMRWLLQRIHEANPARDLDIPGLQDHQKWQNGFMRWYDRLIDGPFNLIFITTSMVEEDAEGETRVIPHIPGRRGEISDYISAQAGFVLYYGIARESRESTSGIIRRALAQTYPPYQAKDRFSALGRRWDVKEGDYTAMSDMIGAIYDALKEDTDAT